jgi:hypothetical protein
MAASLKVLGETDRDHRLPIVARSHHHPQRERASVSAMRRGGVGFKQANLEAGFSMSRSRLYLFKWHFYPEFQLVWKGTLVVKFMQSYSLTVDSI